MKHTKRTKSILNKIETTRQNLEHVTRERDTERAGNLLIALNALYTELYHATKESEADKQRWLAGNDHILVISNECLGGLVLSKSEYIEHVKRMSKHDRATHVAVNVDAEMVSDVINTFDVDQLKSVQKAS